MKFTLVPHVTLPCPKRRVKAALFNSASPVIMSLAAPTTPQPNSSHRRGSSSGSSTLKFCEEPLGAVLPRVHTFVLDHLWPDADHADISINYLRAGGFNRIMAVTRRENQRITHDYILRIPRDPEEADISHNVAAIRFLHLHAPDIPTPTVVAFDSTRDNALESPYMIQTRVPGVSLEMAFPNMSHDQKCKVARELGHMFHCMLQTRSTEAGYPVFALGQESLAAPLCVAPIETTDLLDVSAYSNSIKDDANAIYHLFMELFDARVKRPVAPLDYVDLGYISAFRDTASDMNTMGLFDRVPYTLVHPDFFPRNIMVNPNPLCNEPIVSGILDWDGAIFAPSFISCTPPRWIWESSENKESWDDGMEPDATAEPSTEQGRDLKRVFEAAAGDEYVRFALDPAYRLARSLFKLAMHDMIDSQNYCEADSLLEEWRKLSEQKLSKKWPTIR